MNTPTRPAKRPLKKAPVTRPTETELTPPTKPKAVKKITASNNHFDEFQSVQSKHGTFIMLYSEPGMGKTTLAAQFEKPIFVCTSGEQGIYLYVTRKVVDPTIQIITLEPLYAHDEIPPGTGHPGYNKLMKILQTFRDEAHDLKTLVLDSASGMQDLCYQHCASKLFGGDIDGKDFNSYFAGYSKAAESFWSSEIMATLLEIVAKGLNVVILAHATYKPVDNPVGPDFNQFRPELDKNIWRYTKKDLHGVFFMGQEVQVAVDTKTKKKTALGERRFIGLTPSTYYVAKSWCTPEGETQVECGSSAAETWAALKPILGI